MDAIVNMRNTLGNGVRKMKMFSVPQQKMAAQDFTESKLFKVQVTLTCLKQFCIDYFKINI